MSSPRPGELPEAPACPHCGSRDTELLSPFGTVLANAQYYCNGCKTAFELMKQRGGAPDEES